MKPRSVLVVDDEAPIRTLLRRFIEQGSVADLDTACVDAIRPAPFFLSFSGPSP